MVRLNWTEQSINDLSNIAEYISKDSVKYAAIQIRRIREKAQLLKKQPELGRVVPETQNEKIRELILGNYRIIYYIAGDTQINILTVHHSARRLNI